MTNIKQSKSWRDVIKVHPAADMFPLIEGAEFAALVEDVRQHDLRTPMTVWEDVSTGTQSLLDGRNRLRALIASGRELHDYYFHVVGHCESTRDPYAYVLSANVHRRHLTPAQKRDLIAEVLKAQPEKSNRTIAKQTKVDDKTVAAVRGKLEATAEIPQLTKTVGADGKSRTKAPTQKPATTATETDVSVAKRTGAAARNDDAPALAPQQTDPDCLIALFTTQVRASGLDIARQIEAGYRPRLIERLHEVVDEIEIEAERWAKEVHRFEELPDIPACLKRT